MSDLKLEMMPHLISFRILFAFFVYLLSNVEFSFGISCKDEDNQDVDWFLVYKLPKIDTEPEGSLLHEGKAYAYITADGPKEWTLSSKGVDDQDSILGKTWHDFDNRKQTSDTASLFYNDNAPDPYTKTANGHIKGYFAFDTKTGFWLEHSVPNFGETNKYQYPHTGFMFGQSAICITASTTCLNEIAKHLLFCNPNIYESHIADSINKTLDKDAQTLFSDNPDFVHKKPFTRKSTLTSLGNVVFHTFAKDNQLHVELYSDILAPNLTSSLIAETWRNGAGGILPPACGTNFPVTDAVSISMPTTNRDDPISFPSSNDHSKWAIAMDGGDPWVCIADLNRVDSQKRRGGGAICFRSSGVWMAYQSVVEGTDQCPA